MPHLFVYLGLFLEIVLLALAINTWSREKKALLRFVESASDPDRLKEVSLQLPAVFRAPATQFAGGLQRKAPLDENIMQAMTAAANTSFGLAPPLLIAFGILLSGLIFAPLVATLIETANQISQIRTATQSSVGPRVFIEVKSALEPAFDALHWAFQGSAALLAGIIVVGAVHWWLNRAEAREARFVSAVLDAAIVARPGASAPISGRLTELIAPDRTLGVPVIAFVFFFVAVTAGWSLLYLTAGVKEANAADVYDVWPKEDRREPVTPPPGMDVPVFRGGGSPIKAARLATMMLGPDAIVIANADIGRGQIATLDESSNLARDWRASAPDLTRVLNRFKSSDGVELMVLGHQKVLMRAVLEIFDYLNQGYAVNRVYLIIKRTVLIGGPGGTAIQSLLSLDLAARESDAAPAMRLDIDTSRVSVTIGRQIAIVDRTQDDWKETLSGLVQAEVAGRDSHLPPVVEVALTDRDLTYEKFLEILSSADTTCIGESDCGVPGLGLRFVLAK